jgi:hypothetical protein
MTWASLEVTCIDYIRDNWHRTIPAFELLDLGLCGKLRVMTVVFI